MPDKIRPLNDKEFVQNKDGTRSTERTITVTHPKINSGKPTNIPTLFVVKGQVKEFKNEDRAVDAAINTGVKFPSFKSIPDAVNSAKQRSKQGGASQGPLGK